MYICPCCRKEVPPNAPQCIHCGVRFAAPNENVNNFDIQASARNEGSKSSAWMVVCIVLIAVVAAILMVGIVYGAIILFGNGSSSDVDYTPSASYSEESEAQEEASSDYVKQEYVLYGSDSRYITRSELVGLSERELRIARNEIYARHGRRFKDAELQSYFDGLSWYYGYINPSDFDEKTLNNYEKANVDLITDYEKEMGYR